MKNMSDLERLTKRYMDIKTLVDTKQEYILAKYGYDLTANLSDLVAVKEAINLKRNSVKARAEQLVMHLTDGL